MGKSNQIDDTRARVADICFDGDGLLVKHVVYGACASASIADRQIFES